MLTSPTVSSPFNRPGFGQTRMVFGGGPLTPAIKGIIIVCVVVFLIQSVVGPQQQTVQCAATGSPAGTLSMNPLSQYLGLSSGCFFRNLWLLFAS